MTVVNGVFEGGGAKGLLYIGALKACEEAQLQFAAVAGSSAGAITAMLVASGFSASEVEDMMPRALTSLGGRAGALVSLRRRSLLSSGKLRQWLAEALAKKIKRDSPAEEDRTFADVRDATGISLYVVTMDLASGQPVVFCPDLTPSMSVADAVVASSAIPVAFPAQRFEIATERAEGDWSREVRRVVDGGVWANYPSFVFLDKDFRARHQLSDGAEARDTIGFLLDSVEPKQLAGPDSEIRVKSATFAWNTDRGAAERELGVFGGLVTSPLARVTAILLPLAVLVLGVSWFAREIEQELPLIGRLPDGLEDLALLVLIVLFVMMVVMSSVVAYAVIRLGRGLSDEGLVGVKAAMGVGPNTPYWAGAASSHGGGSARHVAIRLRVPPALTTLASRPSAELMETALAAGYEKTRDTLARVYGPGHPGTPAPDQVAPSEEVPANRPLISVAVFWIGFFVISGLAFSALRATVDDQGVAWWQLVAIFVVGSTMLVSHGLERTRRANSDTTWLRRRSPAVLRIMAIVFLLAGLNLVRTALDNEGDLSIRERMQAQSIRGVVDDVTASAGGFGDDDWVVDVMLEDPLPDFDVESGRVDYWDVDGDEITKCDLSGRCVTMTTNHEFAIDDPAVVFHNEGVAFLEEDRWSLPGFAALWPVLAVWVLALSHAFWRAYRWRRAHDPAWV